MSTYDSSQFDKLPPHSIESEMCALAAMMLCGEERVAFDTVRRQLWPEAFYLPDHVILFRTLCRMADDGKKIDAVTVAADLGRAGVLEEVGGVAYLGQVLSAVPSWHHGDAYARTVAERARERDAIALCDKLRARLMQPMRDGTARDVIGRGIADFFALANRGRDLTIRSLGDALSRFVEARDRPAGEGDHGVATGWRDLDEHYLGAFELGGYALVAARPSMGKSTWVRHLLMRKAAAGVPVGLVAVEEREHKIAGNYISADSGILNHHVARGQLTAEQWAQVMASVGRLSDLPFHMTDAAFDLADVTGAVEMLATVHGCKVIAVDHIHLIDAPARETREQQLTAISGALKQLIKRLGFCGVVAAQLSRPAERNSVPPPPKLTDLRGSGALEEHADSVIFLHREDYYRQSGDPRINGLAQVIVAKNRNGPKGEVTLRADLQHQRFLDCETSPENPFDADDGGGDE